MDPPKVLLIAGPMGAGKTSTAARIARHPLWGHVCEDDAWVRIKQDRPPGELRTPAEQAIVQREVTEAVLSLVAAGRKVVLEFILYEAPPAPLLAYQAALRSSGVAFETRILRPHIDAVVRRVRDRGRPGDAHLEQRRREIAHQLGCLEPPHVDAGWILDTTDLTLEQVYERHFRHLVEGA